MGRLRSQTGVNYITIKSYRDPLTITDVELAIMYRKDRAR